MVTANNYMIRPLTDHQQVVIKWKGLGAVQYTK